MPARAAVQRSASGRPPAQARAFAAIRHRGRAGVRRLLSAASERDARPHIVGRRHASVRTACHSGRGLCRTRRKQGNGVCSHARLRAAHERIGAAACAHALPADPPASSAYFRANRRFARVFVFLARLSCSRLFFKIDQPLQWTAAQAACVEQVRVLTRTARRRHAGAILHKRAPHPTRCQARPRSRQVRRAGSAGEGAWDAVHTVCLHSPNAGLALLGRDAVQGGDLASIHSDEEFAAAVSDGQGGSGRTRRGVSHRVY